METESRLDVAPVPVTAPPDAGEGEVYVFPASFAQQRLWFLDRLEPGSPAYNLYNAVRLVGDLRADVLTRTIEEIVARHETLRTTFATLQGEPVQVISPGAEVRMPLLDLAGLPAGRRDAELAALSVAEAGRPFDLARGPLLRVTLVRLARTEHAVLFNFHHIVGDGWSMGVLVREVASLYTAFAQEKPSPLPDLPLQYADFAQAQREWLQGEVLAEQIAYWRHQLAGLELLDLPIDHPRPAVRSARGGVRGLLLPAEVAGPVADLARRRGTTLFVALLAALQTLLQRWTGSDDVAVGTVVAGRNHLDSEGMIGFFVNTLVLRTDLSGEPSFDELLFRAHTVAVGAFAHQDLPFERLVEELQPERDLARSPFFDVLLVLQNTPPRSFELPGLTLLPVPGGGGAAIFDWTVNAIEAGGALLLSLAHSADLFETSTAERALAHLGSLLRGAAADPGRLLSELPLLSAAERAQLVVEWNDTRPAEPWEEPVHLLFAAQARRHPDRIALEWEEGALSYDALARRARRLAGRLRGLGVGTDVPVGVCAGRGPGLATALLAALEAGGAYLPLDPAYPGERLAYMLADARAPVVLAEERFAANLPDSAAVRLLLGGPEEEGEKGEGASPTGPDHLCYLIYTSGSTGRPKGMGQSHRTLANLIAWQMAFSLGAGATARTLQFASPSFDVSLQETFATWCAGGTLVPAPEEARRDPALLLHRLAEAGIERLFLPYVALQQLAERAEETGAPASLREVITAGERLRVTPQISAFFGRSGAVLRNQYGPSESHVVTEYVLAGDSASWPPLPPIGRPVADTRVDLLDRHLQPVPVGVAGEVALGGAGLARGYLGRSDLTAERFVPDGLGGESGARVYRTGDLARRRADGQLEFLGRIDHQVKIRGFRVEPGEIEAVLGRHPAVGECAVAAREDRTGSPRLVAYVVGRDGLVPAASDLRAFLRQELPDYMMPATFVVLPRMPLTPSGKVDRRRLPAPEAGGGAAAAADAGDTSFVAPRDLLEEGISDVWREVLGLDLIGIHDVFFELGGHSLSATRVASRLRAVFSVDLPLRALFEAPTVAGLADRIRRELRRGAGIEAPSLVAESAGGTGGERAPLSFSQQRLWFLDRFEPGSTVYNLRTAVRFSADLEAPVFAHLFARSLGEIVRRHAALRTRFVEEGGEPVQLVMPEQPAEAYVLPLADLSGLGWRAAEEAGRLVEDFTTRPFDLARGPLLQPLLLRLPGSGRGTAFAMLAAMHHIVSDAWSMGILVRELAILFGAFSQGLPSPLPELRVQYTDFARWQRRWLTGEVLEAELAWWRQRLAGLPLLLELPTDRPRPPVQTLRGTSRGFWIGPELGGAVAALALREGATPFMVLLALYQALLGRWSGQQDFAVGTPIAGRTRVEVEDLIGFFINNLALRADLGGEPSVRELLARARTTALEAYAHQDLPFEKLVEELAPERSLAHSPLFQVVFGLQTAPTGAPTGAPAGAPAVASHGAGLEPMEMESRTAKYDLLVSLTHAGAGFAGLAEYSTDLFDGTTIQRFLEQLDTLLAAAVADPGGRILEIPLLSPAERQHILLEWSGPVTPYPRDTTMHGLFEEQADRRPDAVAVSFSAGGLTGALTYGELETRANRLAHLLKAFGVGPEVLVGLCVERSAEMLVGILGILKAGGAYVPLDPSYPLERLALLLEDAFMPVVLTEERLADRLPAGPMTQLVLLDEDPAALASWSEARPEPRVLTENLVYVMYTSGSTGKPKGVAAVHRGVVRLVRETGYARFGPEEVFLQLAPVSFDASTLEIWGPLANGGRLVVPEPGIASLAELGGLLTDSGVTTLWLTAGLFHEMVDSHLSGLAPVRQLLAGGDVLSPVHTRRVLADLPGQRRVINGYGPTENTTFTCCHPMAEPGDVGASVSIGRPIANTTVYLVDRHGRPVPQGVAGELVIGGDGLARGYLNRPELTAERWRPDAASGLPGGRLYHSGDLARHLPDGRIEFLGRIDQQVKIRGFRIEPGEVEAALARHPAVRESVVVAREDRPGDRRLVAYVVTEALAGEEGERELRSLVAGRLPAHMVPAHVVFLEALPLTTNGKVDRRALPAPGSEGSGTGGFVAPADAVEEELAAIWSEVLGRSPIGSQDNFFELGGHSLLAVRVISQMRDRFGVELPLRVLFEEPTVASLARVLRAAEADESAAAPEAPPLRPLLRNLRPGYDEVFPLSFAQQRLWFLDRLEPGSALYNMPLVVRLEGDLAPALLEATLAEIVRRHETLRTTFRMGAAGGEPVQAVAPPGAFALPLVDLSGLAAGMPEEVRRLAEEDARRPFDLERGPLFRPRLLRLGAADHVVLASMHHIVSDGWSLSILVRELVALYEALGAGVPSPLPELPVQYADYAVWQRRWLTGEVLEAELAWWRERLSGLPALLELPTDRPRPPVQTYAGDVRPVVMGRATGEALTELALASGATLFMALLAAFHALLARYSSQDELAVGSPMAGRGRSELEPLIGFFVNTLVLPADLAARPGFRELVERTRRRTLEAYAHQEVPFERLVEELAPERSLAYPPLFQVMFVLQNAPRGEVDLPGLRLTSMGWGETRTAKFDLTLSLTETAEGPAGTLEYNTDLFDAVTVDRLSAHLEGLLTAALSSPDTPMADLSFLSVAERHQLRFEWNDTPVPVPADLPVHELFAAQAARTPDAPAVAFAGEVLTYRDLDDRTTALAAQLRSLGATPDTRVGLFLERSADLLTGILATWKAGAAWVPLDPFQPDARLALILEDAFRDQPRPILIAHAAVSHRLTGPPDPQIILLDAGWAAAGGEGRPAQATGSAGAGEGGAHTKEPSTAAPPRQPRGLGLAYLLYTSGTTGRPKGVLVDHLSLAHHTRAVLRTFDFRPGDRVPCVTPFTFDAFLLDVLPPLLTGGTVALFDTRPPLDLPGLLTELETATHFDCVPALMRQVVDGLRRRGAALPCLRWAFMGGDAVPTDLLTAVRDVFPNARPTSVYGPTEATVIASFHSLGSSPWEAGRALLGRPLPDALLELRDRNGHLVPLGVAGEVWLGGPGVARGYLHLPDLTAAAWAERDGRRWYRTGDFARRLPDGSVEFLGRVDQQMKVRGFRVELGEIEAVLAGDLGVAEVAVLARHDPAAPGEPRLVACVVPRDPATGEILLAALAERARRRLPEYMIPAGWTLLPAFPLTDHGKLDRRALLALASAGHTGAAGETPYEPPRTPTEELLADLWSQLLGRERVGRRDHFFDLGGHSLMAARLASRTSDLFGTDLPLRLVFEAPVLGNLARRIDAARTEEAGPPPPPIVPVPREGRIPLSFAQERLWFLDQLDPGQAVYNMPLSVRLTGGADPALLAASLGELVCRHEVLRTSFPSVEGSPYQAIAPTAPFALPVIDLRGLPPGSVSREAVSLLAAETLRPFDLGHGPLLRALALLTGDGDLVLSLGLHHTVADGWSMGILQGELAALYGAFAGGLPSPLPDLPVQYADYAVWQRRWLSGEVLERQIAYWHRRLTGAPALLELPTDRPRPPAQSFQGGSVPLVLPADLTRSLQALGRRHGATLFMTVLAAFQTLLHRASGQDVVAVGTPVANRGRTETEGLIGLFVNTLVLTAGLEDDPPFAELLAGVRESSLEAQAHQDLPFEKLVEILAPERSLSHAPLFQVMLTFQNLPVPVEPAGTEGLGGLAMHGVETPLGLAKFDLNLTLAEMEGGLAGSLTYAADLFDEATAARLLLQLETLLAAVALRPEVRPSELVLLSEAQRQQLLLEWSGQETAAPVRCLHHFVEAQAERTPEAAAVRFGDSLMTYAALEGHANRLARLLRRHGVGPEVPVAVFMDRSLEMVVALLGVLKAGGAYVPLDPVYPRERLAFMLEDCQAPVLLSQDWLVGRLPEKNASRRISLDPSFEVLEDEDEERPEAPVAPGHLAYVIYTSGSTGRPKGVAIPHASAAALLEWAAGTFGDDELAGTLASTSICFDLSVFELFVPLSRGGCVLLVESALDLLEIGGEVGGQPVTLINTVPSAAAELVRAAGLPVSVRTINLAGEPIPPALAARLHAPPGVRRLLNLYGPSEDTTYSTMERVLPQLSLTAPPAIGRPIAGTRAYVLDGALQPVAPGIPGELYLGGAGLARGYFRRPELTAERFVPDLFAGPAAPGLRLYRTGDRVRHLADGRLDFLGRIDHQVKLRGFRIELGEVEAVLALHPGVKQAVAGVREAGRDRRLVAWFVPVEGAGTDVQELRAFLGERLPHYMVPSALVALAALPLTPTGKLDRRALPDPDVEAGLSPRDFIELELARLWEEVLGTGPVGVRDDFFQLGGHSLLAVRLMALIRERLGRDLPLASLFRAPTVERLAALLRQEGEVGERQALVEITPPRVLPAVGAARPFFCVHPAGGNVLCYLDLARALGPDQPFYGLQLPTAPVLRSVEKMATHYIAAIRAVQPHGPYLLGGWSIGGIIAFEMTQQLTAAGEEVGLLTVIDSVLAIHGEETRADEFEMISLFAQDLAFTYGREFVVSMSVAELRSLDPAQRLYRLLTEAQEAHLLPPDMSLAEAERLFVMYRTTREAMDRYVPRPYPGRITACFAAEGADQGGGGSAAGWENVAGGGVEVERIAGDHYSILRPPMVAEVAARLAARIQALGGSDPR